MEKIVFWDFDGTLGYREGNWEEVFFELAANEKLKTKANYELVSRLLQDGFPWHAPEKNYTSLCNPADWWSYVMPKFIQVFEALGYDQQKARINASGVAGQYLELEKWKLYDDVIPALQLFQAGKWKNILVTNNVPEFLSILEGLHITEYFEKIFISAATGFNKPNPKIINGYLDHIQNEASIFVVGDRMESDICFARNIHAKGILVRSGVNNESDLYFDNLTGLANHILPE